MTSIYILYTMNRMLLILLTYKGANICYSPPALCVFMLKQVLQSMQDRLKVILSQPDLKKHIHRPGVKAEVICLLECMCGAAEATGANSVGLLFSYLHPALVQCVHLLGEC